LYLFKQVHFSLVTSLTGLYHDWYLQVQRHFISAEGAAGPCRLVAYQECHRKGESSTQAVLQASTVSQYFGNPDDEDSVGLAEQLLMGTALFSGLFNKEELASTTTSPTTGAADATTTGSNVARLSTSASVVLVLKPEMHCLGADKRIIVGGSSGITLPLLLSGSLNCNKMEDSSARLQGRTLMARIQEHIRNCRKALSIVNRYESPYKSLNLTGSLPSGMGMEDYYMFVRKNMYYMLVANKKATKN
jgi:hypothetical protein